MESLELRARCPILEQPLLQGGVYRRGPLQAQGPLCPVTHSHGDFRHPMAPDRGFHTCSLVGVLPSSLSILSMALDTAPSHGHEG